MLVFVKQVTSVQTTVLIPQYGYPIHLDMKSLECTGCYLRFADPSHHHTSKSRGLGNSRATSLALNLHIFQGNLTLRRGH